MYVSIDIETLGLDPDSCDIIEFGAVLDDLNTPVEKLPTFHCYIPKETYKGQPYAMSMHSDSLRKIAQRDADSLFIPPDLLDEVFSRWLIENKIPCTTSYLSDEPIQAPLITVAGKNFAGFDLRFLRRLPNWGKRVKIRRRLIDPAMLYFNPLTMDAPPDLKTCLKMAGIEKEVSHIALDDAFDVIRCLRFKYKI